MVLPASQAHTVWSTSRKHELDTLSLIYILYTVLVGQIDAVVGYDAIKQHMYVPLSNAYGLPFMPYHTSINTACESA
jgi:hypothetical protein